MVEGINLDLSVCPSVSIHSHCCTIWRTDPKFGGGVDLDNILGNLEGQGHKSKVKVSRLKNVFFGFSDRLTCKVHYLVSYDVIWRHCVTSGRYLTSLSKNTDKEGRTRDCCQCSGVFIKYCKRRNVREKCHGACALAIICTSHRITDMHTNSLSW